MLFIGADPDLHDCPVAYLEDSGKVLALSVFKSHGLKGAAAAAQMAATINRCPHKWSHKIVAAVEGQEIVRGAGEDNDTKNPRDLINLAAVAGSLMGMLCWTHPMDPIIYYPKPHEWKGSVPKEIHQARTCASLGWKYEKYATHCVPQLTSRQLDPIVDSRLVNKGDWKHVLDAIGLALWAREKYLKDTARDSRLKAMGLSK